MKLLVKRYANAKSDVVGFVKVESDAFTLLKKDSTLKGILNGCELFSSGSDKESFKKTACLSANIISQLCAKNAIDQVTFYKSHWKHKDYPAVDLLDSVSSCISDRLKVAMRFRPREEVKNFLPIPHIATAIDSELLSKNLRVFMRKAANMSIALKNALRGGEIITGRKLVGSMWGAKKTQRFLDSENKKVASIRHSMDTIAMHQELMFRGIGKLQACINEKKLDKEKRKVIAKIVIPSIVDSYCEHKKFASNVMLELSPLLYIDEIFKSNTNYPVSWFVSEETLDNMCEDFEHLASYLGEIPSIESKVIIPLDMLGSQITE